MNIHIRRVLEEMFGAQAWSVPVLYGGTVNEGNCRELLLEGRPDGLFVGRAAWNVEGFARLIAACATIHNLPSGDPHEDRAYAS